MATGSPTALFRDAGSSNSSIQIPRTSIQTQQDVDNGVAPRLRAVVIFFEILSIIAVVLRLVARRVSAQVLSWDDWLAVMATVLSAVNMANDVLIIGLGAGTHLAQIDPANMNPFLKSVYVGQVIYAPIIVSIKMSILFLYLRLFNPNRRFCKIVYGLVALTVTWGIAATITAVLQCTPVEAVWNTALASNAQCINLTSFLIGANIPDILFDIAILVLPAPMIWKLKVPTSKKVAILSIFLLAAFDLIMAVIRLGSLANFNKDDPTFGFTGPMIWSTVEINVGLICACLPVMTPIFQKCFGKWLSNWSTKSSSGKSGHNATRRAITVNDIGTPSGFRRLGDEEDGMGVMAKGTYEMSKPAMPPPPPPKNLDWPPARVVTVIRPKSGVPF